jgi:hypothetical protein
VQHVADGAEFALVVEALAQQGGGRIAAAVYEFREIDGDDNEVVEVAGNFLDAVVRLQEQADALVAGDDLGLAAPAIRRAGR